MHDLIRVLILGTGQMGQGISRLLLSKSGLKLVGAYGRRAERSGMNLGRIIGCTDPLDIRVSSDLSALIEQTQPHIAIQATSSILIDAKDELMLLVRKGVNVISIAEEMAYPEVKNSLLAAEIRKLAVDHDVSVLGTGINPGFVLDLLIITMTGVCAQVDSITAKRVNDLSPYGPSVLNTQGVGLTPEAFESGLKDGSVKGHFGFEESIHMIAAKLGWKIDRIDQKREPIIATLNRETPFVTVESGQVAGCLHTATAFRDDRAVIKLIHPQQVHPFLEGVETGDMIDICGEPNIKIAGSPEIPGGQGTVALAVNMIPRVLNAEPGLYSMADLPPPAAMLADARNFLTRAL